MRRMSETGPRTEDEFSASWDQYADASRRAGQRWPGDDWGDEELWRRWFARLLEAQGVASWRRAVEIGQGTGKYTRMVLDAGPAEVLACDVSATFLELCRERLQPQVEAGRLHLRRISSVDPDALRDAAAGQGWLGSVDAVYSIDTLVHVPFTQIAGYLLQATEILRPGGWVVISFADGTTEAGRRKLFADLHRVIRGGGHPTTGCFHWIAPELLRTTAEAIGYRVALCEPDDAHRRDGHFVAEFADPDRARAAREFAAAAG
jgi:SAM-dependent methyltransferase